MKTDTLKLFPTSHRLGSAGWSVAHWLLVAVALILPAPLPSARAAVTEVWAVRYNNVVSNANGWPNKLVRDAAGDIIVAGYANDGVVGQDMLTVKYSGVDGSVIWQRRYNGPANGNDNAQALAVDRQGNVVVAGSSFAGWDPGGYLVSLYDYYIAKYASVDGALLWERRYRDPDYTDAAIQTLLVDRNDDVVILGSGHTAKFAAADGARLWLQPYPGVTVAAALTGSGDVFVTGTSFSSSTYEDIYTLKYAASDGALLWARRYNGTNWQYSVDYARTLMVDSRGDVVVTGYNGNTRDGDGYAAKYAGATGALLWEQQGGGRMVPLALDSQDNVVMTGFTTTGFKAWGWPVYTDYFLTKLAAGNGAVMWAIDSPVWPSATFDNSGNLIASSLSHYGKYAAADGALLDSGEFPFGSTIAVGRWPVMWIWDGSNNVVITAGYFETAKYTVATGAELWHQQFLGPVNLADYASAVAVDSSGNVIVTGSSAGSGGGFYGFDYYTAKYAAANGALIWERRYNGPANNEDTPVDVALDRVGNVIVTGTSWKDFYTAKYAAADGALLWEKRYEDPIHYGAFAAGVAVDGSGNVAVTGSSWDGQERRVQYTAKYAGADGALLWGTNYYDRETGLYQPNAIAMDRNGNVVVAGSGITVKYSAADGSVLWKHTSSANLLAIAADSSGNVVVTGNGTTAKYAAEDGALIWEIAGASSVMVAVDDRDDVIVAGNIDSTGGTIGYYVGKYASATGAPLSGHRYEGSVTGHDFRPASHPLALGRNGTIALTGYSSVLSDPLIIWGGDHAYDFVTVVYEQEEDMPLSLKLRPSGNEMILSWPENVLGLMLQSTPSLTPPVTWMAVTNPLTLIGGQLTVTNTASGGAQFFRLRRP